MRNGDREEVAKSRDWERSPEKCRQACTMYMYMRSSQSDMA